MKVYALNWKDAGQIGVELSLEFIKQSYLKRYEVFFNCKKISDLSKEIILNLSKLNYRLSLSFIKQIL